MRYAPPLVRPWFTRFFGALLRSPPPRSRRIPPLLAASWVLCLAAAGRPAASAGLSLSASFAGPADQGGGVPPDVQGAAGPDHLLTMLNTAFVAQRKSDGAVVRTWSPSEFWAPVAGGDLLFDSRVAFDALAGRWIAVMATEGVFAQPAVLLAVSATSDPTGEWRFRKLPVGGGEFAEFPLVGFNGRWIVVTSNLVSPDGFLSGSAVWAAEKAPLLLGDVAAVTRFTLGTPGSPIAPVVTLDASEPDEFLLQESNGNENGHGRLRLFRVTDSGGSASLTAPKIVTAPATWSDMPARLESLPQAGTSRRIISDQDEISSASLRNGKIWAVQTATIPPAASIPVHTVVQWWRITPDGGLEAFGRIGDPAGATWLGFPSIAVNSEGEALIGYSLFSAGRFASAGFSIRSKCGGDPALSDIHVLKDGEAPYVRPDGGGNNRWGDLSQTVADPDGRRLWTLQEYAGTPEAGQSRWGTWWGGFEPPADARGGACIHPVPKSSPATPAPRPTPSASALPKSNTRRFLPEHSQNQFPWRPSRAVTTLRAPRQGPPSRDDAGRPLRESPSPEKK